LKSNLPLPRLFKETFINCWRHEFFERAIYKKFLINFEVFKCAYKVREWVLKWDITKELYSLLQILFYLFKDFICIYNFWSIILVSYFLQLFVFICKLVQILCEQYYYFVAVNKYLFKFLSCFQRSRLVSTRAKYCSIWHLCVLVGALVSHWSVVKPLVSQRRWSRWFRLSASLC